MKERWATSSADWMDTFQEERTREGEEEEGQRGR